MQHKPFQIHITKLSFKVKPKPQQYYVTYHAKNGEILATSEIFTEKKNCLKNIKSMIKNMGIVISVLNNGNIIGRNRLKYFIEDYGFKS